MNTLVHQSLQYNIIILTDVKRDSLHKDVFYF